MPAFFDTYFHWVQDDVRQMPKVSLIEWLERYTFPEKQNIRIVFLVLKQSNFGTNFIGRNHWRIMLQLIHEVALEEAFKHAPEDFYIGNVLMTMNCPEDIRRAYVLVRVEIAPIVIKVVMFVRQDLPTTCPEAMQASALAAAQHNCFNKLI